MLGIDQESGMFYITQDDEIMSILNKKYRTNPPVKEIKVAPITIRRCSSDRRNTIVFGVRFLRRLFLIDFTPPFINTRTNNGRWFSVEIRPADFDSEILRMGTVYVYEYSTEHGGWTMRGTAGR